MQLKNTLELGRSARLFLQIALLSFSLEASFVEAQSTNAVSATDTVSATDAVSAQPSSSATQTLQDSFQAYHHGDIDGALAKVNEIIKNDSQNKEAYLLRATIYAHQKLWDKAASDYQEVQIMDPQNFIVKFDLSELNFMQKKYDDARAGFVEVQNNKDIGDFVVYKIFLCDLFAGHEELASKELAAFNEKGGDPSYYFGNAAWDLVHHKPDDAVSWLNSAKYIYANSPQKYANYTASLTDLGYLPIHLSSTP